jgi:hypothetical protein
MTKHDKLAVISLGCVHIMYNFSANNYLDYDDFV